MWHSKITKQLSHSESAETHTKRSITQIIPYQLTSLYPDLVLINHSTRPLSMSRPIPIKNLHCDLGPKTYRIPHRSCKSVRCLAQVHTCRKQGLIRWASMSFQLFLTPVPSSFHLPNDSKRASLPEARPQDPVLTSQLIIRHAVKELISYQLSKINVLFVWFVTPRKVNEH